MKINVMSEVIRQIDEIKADRVHGASHLSRKALEVLKLVIQKGSVTKEDFLERLKSVGDRLTKVRPNMAPIANLAAHLVYEVFQASEEKELDFLKDLAYSKTEELERFSKLGLEKAATHAAKIIEDNDRIMTCSYSSTIKEVLRIAHGDEKHVRVWVLESRHRDKSYGKIMAEELCQQKIFARVIPDTAIRNCITEVKKVLVGADSVLSDGSLINGLPTYELALAAKDRLPFYVVCETLKFNPRVSSKQVKLEEGFDLTPPELITEIVTETGTFKPENVVVYMKELVRYFDVFKTSARVKHY
ncbi:MAG: translation initiation factor eIF-2B [bacterium]